GDAEHFGAPLPLLAYLREGQAEGRHTRQLETVDLRVDRLGEMRRGNARGHRDALLREPLPHRALEPGSPVPLVEDAQPRGEVVVTMVDGRFLEGRGVCASPGAAWDGGGHGVISSRRVRSAMTPRSGARAA